MLPNGTVRGSMPPELADLFLIGTTPDELRQAAAYDP
jgi:hypothetical protein